MPLPIKTIEEFFGTKFQFEQRLAELRHYDGFVYWHLLWTPEDGQFLKIAADREPVLMPFPILEFEGRYTDDISISPLTAGGVALVLCPEATDLACRRVVITKTKSGRLSLSTGFYEKYVAA